MVYAAVLTVLLVLFYSLFILPTQWLKIERVSHDIGIKKRIMQISDLHMERNRVSSQKIINILEKEKPDYIFFTGDFLDLASSLPKIERYLEAIRQLDIPMYAVLGNHDYELKEKIDDLINIIKSKGITLLRNESVNLGQFTLVGIDDFYTKNYDVKKAYEHVEPDSKVVIMTHDADVAEITQKYGFKYLMAGHLHGKQINIPYLFKLKPMGKLASLGIYKNLHHFPYGTLYISKGLGQSGINARLFVRSEVTIHQL